MRDIQAPWVGGEYEPMVNTDKPWAVCEYCGRAIYPGDTYLDADQIMCSECIKKYTQKAG